MIDPKSLDLAALPWLPLDERAAFPHQPVIYFAIDRHNEIQYIGISKDPKRRWYQHHQYEKLHERGGIKIAYLFVENVELLRPIESALIAWFCPPLNVIGVSSLELPPKRAVSVLGVSSSMTDMEGLLAQAGVSREDLAEKLDISSITVRNWIGGRTTPSLNPGQYEALLALLGVTPSELTVAWKESMANRRNRKPGRKKQ